MSNEEEGWRPLDSYINNGEKSRKEQMFWVNDNQRAKHELMAIRDKKSGVIEVRVVVGDKWFIGQVIGWALDYPHIRVSELNQSFEFSWATVLRAIKDKKALRA